MFKRPKETSQQRKERRRRSMARKGATFHDFRLRPYTRPGVQNASPEKSKFTPKPHGSGSNHDVSLGHDQSSPHDEKARSDREAFLVREAQSNRLRELGNLEKSKQEILQYKRKAEMTKQELERHQFELDNRIAKLKQALKEGKVRGVTPGYKHSSRSPIAVRDSSVPSHGIGSSLQAGQTQSTSGSLRGTSSKEHYRPEQFTAYHHHPDRSFLPPWRELTDKSATVAVAPAAPFNPASVAPESMGASVASKTSQTDQPPVPGHAVSSVSYTTLSGGSTNVEPHTSATPSTSSTGQPPITFGTQGKDDPPLVHSEPVKVRNEVKVERPDVPQVWPAQNPQNGAVNAPQHNGPPPGLEQRPVSQQPWPYTPYSQGEHALNGQTLHYPYTQGYPYHYPQHHYPQPSQQHYAQPSQQHYAQPYAYAYAYPYYQTPQQYVYTQTQAYPSSSDKLPCRR